MYARHGVRDNMFGVSFADLGRLAKAAGIDQGLAEGLWATGNHDARMLATRVADADSMGPGELDAWARELDNYLVTDALAVLAAQSPHRIWLMVRWMDATGEWVRAAGWTMASLLALHDEEIAEEEWLALVKRIEAEIGAAQNRVRHAMNQALIAIGVRSDRLRDAALEAAGRIGKVQVDHGETGCKTPDAASYIRKTLEHRGRQNGARRT